MANNPNTFDWQNAYQTSADVRSEFKRENVYRRFWAILAVLVMPMAFAMEIVTDSLAELDFLNQQPIWPVDQQAITLTLRDYATNHAVWEMVTYAIMFGAVPIFLWGFVILAKQTKN